MSDSKLFETVVGDVKKLKEVALENAKQQILKENHKQVKSAFMALLEAEEKEEEKPEDIGGDLPPTDPTQDAGDVPSLDMGAPAGNPADPNALDAAGMGQAEESPIVDAVPNTFGAGSKTCTCPDDDEKIVVTLDDIKESYLMYEDEDEDETWKYEKYGDENLLLPDDELELEVEPDLTSMKPQEVSERGVEGLHYSWTEPDGTMFFEDEQGEIYSADDLNPVLVQRILAVSGPTFEAKNLLASTTSAFEAQIRKHFRSLTERHETEREYYEAEIVHLQEQLATYDQIFEEIKGETVKLRLHNSILQYKTKTLEDASLNERQKAKIIESIAKAKSEIEAKNLYEAVKGSLVESTSTVVETGLSGLKRNSGMAFGSRLNETKEMPKEDPEMARWLKLANIKKQEKQSGL